jgi:hypothetical protein
MLCQGGVLQDVFRNICDQPVNLDSKLLSRGADEEMVVVGVTNVRSRSSCQLPEFRKCGPLRFLSCATSGGAGERHPGGGEGCDQRIFLHPDWTRAVNCDKEGVQQIRIHPLGWGVEGGGMGIGAQ